MSPLHRGLVWLSRILHSWGFGIQSPTDYAFVRYVVNEHWPYYAYQNIKEKDWKARKLGRLYLRLANWRQPVCMERDEYEKWWQAGCRTTKIVPKGTLRHIELARMDISEDWESVVTRCDSDSVVVAENIWQDWQRWHTITADERVGTTYDLYYCGIVWFDKQRYNHHYKINF